MLRRSSISPQDSSAAFQELADHFTYIGKPHLRGALSISADGTTLSYTTPCKDGLVVIFFEDANSLPAILIREAGEWYSI